MIIFSSRLCSVLSKSVPIFSWLQRTHMSEIASISTQASSASSSPSVNDAALTAPVSEEDKQNAVKSLENTRKAIAETVLKYSIPYTPRLVAVSKTKPVELLKAVYDANQQHFGENYVQELVAKAPLLPSDIKWHFIGHLQSNKAQAIVAIPNLFMVETVDSQKLATALEKACVKLSRPGPLSVLIQVNSSGEESKSGVESSEVLELATFIRTQCPHLKFSGLMTIGQIGRVSSDQDPNPDFKMLVNCRKELANSLSIAESDLELSFGMSNDFEHAISMGSTNVRVGSTIFGSRTYHK